MLLHRLKPWSHINTNRGNTWKKDQQTFAKIIIRHIILVHLYLGDFMMLQKLGREECWERQNGDKYLCSPVHNCMKTGDQYEKGAVFWKEQCCHPCALTACGAPLAHWKDYSSTGIQFVFWKSAKQIILLFQVTKAMIMCNPNRRLIMRNHSSISGSMKVGNAGATRRDLIPCSIATNSIVVIQGNMSSTTHYELFKNLA